MTTQTTTHRMAGYLSKGAYQGRGRIADINHLSRCTLFHHSAIGILKNSGGGRFRNSSRSRKRTATYAAATSSPPQVQIWCCPFSILPLNMPAIWNILKKIRVYECVERKPSHRKTLVNTTFARVFLYLKTRKEPKKTAFFPCTASLGCKNLPSDCKMKKISI